MVILDYNLRNSELSRLQTVNWRNVDETDLDYYLFKGDILFRVDNANFDAGWGWIPILDFATQIFKIVAELKMVERNAFEFTESDAAIKFELRRNLVVISSNYSPDEGKINYEELHISVSGFLHRVLTELGTHFPELRKNQYFLSRVELASRQAL